MDKLRAALAEFIGTFFLTFVAAGGVVIADATGKSAGSAALLVAPGLVVMVMIFSLGEVSGAHINPAVTLAFAARGDFQWRLVPIYIVAQLTGATVAAETLLVTFGQHVHLGATVPHAGILPALLMESVLTTLLVTVILATAAEARVVGNNAALAVAAAITTAGFIGDPVSGASMNPARSFGPALLGHELGTYWIYLVGPLTGAAMACLLATVFFGRADQEEKHKAEGHPRSARR